MHIYSKCVSGKRFGEELILEKMKYSPEFSNFINVRKILNVQYQLCLF
jgi:hypothetical protein